MSWRPKGWKNLYCLLPLSKRDCDAIGIFETGADAMLEALIKSGIHTKRKEFLHTVEISATQSGVVVFIPDEVKDV